MNKFKFFGSAIMAAFFAFSLASCEKEDFKTDVDIDGDEIIIPGNEPETKGDAVISLQPVVWAVIDGNIDNVTSEATITYNGKAKLEYTVNSDQGTSAMTVAIVATYDAKVGDETKTLTATANIEIPALSAGQVYVLSPTLIMRAQSGVDETPQTPEGYKPGDAVISIQPEVLSLINGELKNVTGDASVTFNGAEKFTYTVNEDKGTSEMTVKIDASYTTTIDGEVMTLTATTTITIPALSAGQVAIFMPQLIVSYNSEETPDDPIIVPGTPGTDTYTVWTSEELEGGTETAHFDYKNSSNYYYDNYVFSATVAEWGITLESKDVKEAKYNGSVESWISSLAIAGEKEFQFKGITLYANSVTCVNLTLSYKRVKWTLLECEVGSASDGRIVAEVIFRVDLGHEADKINSTSLNINGHGHGSSGHSHGHGNGHGHGHGADNAGGGIVYPM